MKSRLLRTARKLNKNRKQRKWWQRVVHTMAIVVVFCTTYALILPAITMEKETLCGIEAHEHADSCYTQQPVAVFDCGLEDGVKVVHSHDAACYDDQEALICILEEIVEHTHGEECITQSETPMCDYVHVHNEDCAAADPVLICEQEETEGHTHSSQCATRQTLICELPETEGHAHSESCGSTETLLICTEAEGESHTHGESCYEVALVPCEIPESDAHTHGEDCYETQDAECTLEEQEAHVHGEACYAAEEPCELTTNDDHTHEDACFSVPCDREEIALHTHAEECFNDQSELICTLPQVVAHAHTEDCMVQSEEVLSVLVCELQEHIHEESCYPAEEADNGTYEYICSSGVHAHVETCYDEAGELYCTIPEHAHTAACIVEDLDLTADVESEQQWKQTMNKLTLTGNWPTDVLTVAESQLGYTESVRNVILVNDRLKGYTRYGEWYGDHYGDWCAMYASFCLHYAGVEDYPLESEVNLWIAELTQKELYFPADTYVAKPGDLIFFDYDQKRDAIVEIPVNADHVGFVVEYLPAAEGEVAKIRTIEGNSNDQVAYVTYELDDPAIIGYGKVPAGNALILEYQGADFTVTVKVGTDAGIPETAQLAVREILPGTDEYNEYYQQAVAALMDSIAAEATEEAAAEATEEAAAEATEEAAAEATEEAAAEATEEAAAEATEEAAAEATEEATAETTEETAAEATEEAATETQISFARFFDIHFLVDGQPVEPSAPVDIQIRYSESIAVSEEENGLVVHFAEDGVEVLDAQTYSADPEAAQDTFLDNVLEFFSGETEQVDTFQFTQDSFSISGTIVTNAARASTFTTATRVHPYEIDNTGTTWYVLYAQVGNRYYALDGNGYPVAVTVSGDTVTLSGNNTDNLLWTFTEAGDYYQYNSILNVGTGRYLHPYNNGGTNTGTTTANPYLTSLTEIGDYTFKIQGNGQYARFPNGTAISQAVANANQATTFYVARAGQVFNVWFDGTNGGMMSYYGAADTNIPVVVGSDNTVTINLPETWQSSTKYDYTLRGWYDVYNGKYYAVNPNDDVIPTATINSSTVFYADWVAATYDVGQQNEHVVNSLDTNDFITTYVFDYNVLFNVLSQTFTGTISAVDHTETWTIRNNGEIIPYNNQPSLGFSFVDYDSDGEFSYPLGRDNTNINQGDAITPGILNEVYNASGGKNLLDLLFNPNTEVIGKNYVGTGNYLFQYMDSTTENYDGVHDGYYYLDARLNAASYNQSLQRFYLYDYLERTSDSNKDGGVGQYSDFLPFNSPYLFDADQLNNYTDAIRRPGYEYDAKDGESSFQEYNSVDDATTNYFFGIRTDIEFFLPNDSGNQDEYGNYGNISTRGEHMIFDFHGDDDVWVFVDGELVLDIGGLHGVMFGQIDFSTGTVITGKDGGTTTTQTFRQLLGHNITEGTHTMTVYYMERGSSQSNCAIYFNIAPRYDLEITKEDIATADKLDGAVFSIFNDEQMTSPAQLWASEEAYNEDMADGVADHATNTFSVVNGIAKCWGISAGKTYYIYETTPPPGYPASDDMIRITLNNRGTATIETTTLHGSNGVATEGFAVIKQEVNDTLKIVALTVTNQKEGEHTEVRVEKTWADGYDSLPQSITVYLTSDGVPVGRRAILNEANGWSYTWTGLPKYAEEGIDQEIIYEVQEVLVPGFITTQGQTQKVVDYVDWIRVAQMSDSKTFLLVHNGQALTYDGGFGWMDPAEAELDGSLSAQWNVTTDHDGFHLKNGLGYTLTYGSGGFYGINNDAVELNQVFYYLNSRLVVHDHDVYYQFGNNGSVVSEDGLAFTLYQKEVLTGFLTGITNVPVEEDEQTFVEVTKVWEDGNELHVNDPVTIRLYADGQDTGRTLILNAENNWTGGFYDLPYYQEDGTTVVVYTVVEDQITNYVPSYSDPEILDGLHVVIWQDAGSLAANEIYRFTSGSYALAVDKDGNVIAANSDLNDAYQQWKVVGVGGGRRILQNVGSGAYLTRNNTNLSTTNSQSGAEQVSLTNGYVMLGQMYLEIRAGYAGATNNSANVVNQKVTLKVNTTGKEGVHYTVTNSMGYQLPATGGMGIFHFTFGGLLIMAAALMYGYSQRRKRERRGSR